MHKKCITIIAFSEAAFNILFSVVFVLEEVMQLNDSR